MRGRLIGLALLAGLVAPAGNALALPSQQPASVSGGVGVRLVDVPATVRDPRARSYIVNRIAPGTSVSRRIEISNSTQSAMRVAVYPAGASLHQGTFAFAPGRSQNELSGWTSVRRGTVSLAPGTAAVDTVTIRVPKDAAPGERYAVVWAEVAAPASNGVTLVNRVGVRMYVSIGSGGAPAADFTVGSITAARSAQGEPLVLARIHNRGERTIEVSGTITLADGPGGLRAGPLPVVVGAGILPGLSRGIAVRLDGRLPRGPWRGRIGLRSGGVERSAAATITFPVQRQAATRSSRSTSIIILIVLLTLAAIGLLIGRRRRRPAFLSTRP